MESMIKLECIQPGSGAFLIDQGRNGFRHLGICGSGAADQRAAQRARTLLELPDQAALMEFTQTGGQWILSGKGQFVLTGADMNWRINGRPAELYTTTDFDGDYIFDGGLADKGCRSYLAIRGKWMTPRLMNSVSPGLPEIGKITAGWSVEVKPGSEVDYSSDLDIYQHIPANPCIVSVMPGPEWSLLNSNQQSALLSTKFKVGKESNRQGLRLEPVTDNASEFSTGIQSMISSAVLPGTIQLPSSGPVLLLKDAQTIGGFPRVLVCSQASSLDELGQLKPGDLIQFSLNG